MSILGDISLETLQYEGVINSRMRGKRYLYGPVGLTMRGIKEINKGTKESSVKTPYDQDQVAAVKLERKTSYLFTI